VVPPFTRKAGHPVVLGVSRPHSSRREPVFDKTVRPPGSTLRRTPMVVKKALVAVARRPAAGDAATDTLHHVLHPARIGRSNALQVASSRAGASTAPGVPQRGRQPILRNRGRTRRARP